LEGIRGQFARREEEDIWSTIAIASDCAFSFTEDKQNVIEQKGIGVAGEGTFASSEGSVKIVPSRLTFAKIESGGIARKQQQNNSSIPLRMSFANLQNLQTIIMVSLNLLSRKPRHQWRKSKDPRLFNPTYKSMGIMSL
jgi:hypothetical protein